jgi:Big-like domain-containing protein
MRPSRWVGALLAILTAVACSPKPVTIDLSPKKVKIYGIERAQRMTARILDKKGQPMEGAPDWSSSDNAVVAAEPGGRLVAKGAGKASVTAAFGKIRAQVPVEVVDVSTIELATPALSLIGPVGTTVPLSFTVKDSKGQRLELKPSWASEDPKVATVSDQGTVTSVAAGKTTIVARIGDLQGGCQVDVIVHPIARLEIRPVTALVHVGDSQHFQVTAYGPDGVAITEVAASFQSSDPAVATVDSAGVASGHKAGAAVIRVELAGTSAEATLLVN